MRNHLMNDKVSFIKTFKFILGCLLISAASNLNAEIVLPNIFSDHMVLQRDQQNRIWGKADPGQEITVSIADQVKKTKTDTNGFWSLKLDPMEAGGPYVLTLQNDNGDSLSILDILVGEVWVCSGQSNMQWTMNKAYDTDLERLRADVPTLRFINFPRVASQEPVFTHGSHWQIMDPETVKGCSAVAYYFGKQLHDTLDVPVGLVHNAWGGSSCEAWVSRKRLEEAGYDEMLKLCDEYFPEWVDIQEIKKRSPEQDKRFHQLRGRVADNHRPANIYNGVLKSHLGYGMRGVIWYQGESNASRAYQYRELFPLMIQTWRDEWGQGDFPFYWVQLADFLQESQDTQNAGWPELREAQTMTLDQLPNTGQAVIIDSGEGRDIHPRDKCTVGKRLARHALANDYGYDLACQSPRYDKMEIIDGKAVLTFDHVDGKLVSFDVNEPIGFAVAGDDKKFVQAKAKIVADNKIEVWSSEQPNPVAVRYGWANNPVVNVYDSAHLPLTPFRTDDWPGITVGKE